MGSVSRKSRKLFGPEKPSVKLPTACCFHGNKKKNDREVSSYLIKGEGVGGGGGDFQHFTLANCINQTANPPLTSIKERRTPLEVGNSL